MTVRIAGSRIRSTVLAQNRPPADREIGGGGGSRAVETPDEWIRPQVNPQVNNPLCCFAARFPHRVSGQERLTPQAGRGGKPCHTADQTQAERRERNAAPTFQRCSSLSFLHGLDSGLGCTLDQKTFGTADSDLLREARGGSRSAGFVSEGGLR